MSVGPSITLRTLGWSGWGFSFIQESQTLGEQFRIEQQGRKEEEVEGSENSSFLSRKPGLPFLPLDRALMESVHWIQGSSQRFLCPVCAKDIQVFGG